MAQELQVLENGSLDISTLKKNVSNAYVELAIVCKKIKATVKGKVKEFNTAKVVMPLDTYDVDGNYKGFFNKKVDLHFQMDAFKTPELDVASVEDLTTGSLFVLASKIQAPTEYRPRYATDEDGNIELDDNGNPIIEYPVAWVKDNGVVGFIPRVASQEQFTPKKRTHNDAVDAESGEVRSDEDLKKEAENLTNE